MRQSQKETRLVFVHSMGVEVLKRLHEQHYATGCSNTSLSITGLKCVQTLNGHVEDQEPKFVCDVQTRHDWSTGMASPKTYAKVRPLFAFCPANQSAKITLFLLLTYPIGLIAHKT